MTRIIHDGVVLYELGKPAAGLEEEKDYLTYTRDLDSGFRVIQMIPKDVVYKNMEPFLKGYGIWFGCSVVTGFDWPCIFPGGVTVPSSGLWRIMRSWRRNATGCGRRNAYMSF